MTELLVNAELAHGRVPITQSAVAQAVKRHIAFFLFVGMRLQLVLDTQVFVEPGGAHGACRQAGHTDELHHVFLPGLGQHPFEGRVCIAFQGDGKGRAQLHRRRSQGLKAQDVGVAADAACSNQGNLALNPRIFEERQHLRNHALKVKSRVLQVGYFGSAQMTARQARMLNHDGVR